MTSRAGEGCQYAFFHEPVAARAIRVELRRLVASHATVGGLYRVHGSFETDNGFLRLLVQRVALGAGFQRLMVTGPASRRSRLVCGVIKGDRGHSALADILSGGREIHLVRLAPGEPGNGFELLNRFLSGRVVAAAAVPRAGPEFVVTGDAGFVRNETEGRSVFHRFLSVAVPAGKQVLLRYLEDGAYVREVVPVETLIG